MYRMLIVDDETYILEGLVQLFSECDRLELDIYKTYSSLEALDIIKKNKIDIVLSDIRMPEMDGFQLQEQISYYLPKCKVIFLTGYSEFDYVYSAIHKKNVSYILKTENDENIIKSVETAIREINEETERLNIIKKAEMQIKQMAPLLRKELFEMLLHGEIHAEDLSEEHFRDLKIRLDIKQKVVIVIGRINGWPENTSYMNKMNTYYSVQEIMENLMKPFVDIESIMLGNAWIVWFMQPATQENIFSDSKGEIDWKWFTNYIRGNIETAQNTCRELLRLTISFVISKYKCEWGQLHSEFDLIRNVMEKRIPHEHQMIIDLNIPGDFLGNKPVSPAMSSSEFSDKIRLLEKHLVNGQQSALECICIELVHSIKDEMSTNYMIAVERYYTLLLVFIDFLNKYNILDYTEKINIDISKLLTAEIPGDWDRLVQLYVGIGRLILMHIKGHSEKENDLVIERIHKFIRDNLGGDLSLSQIAKVVYFNPSYLSRFYKQATGKNLSEFISAEKIDRAKELLATTKLKVNEIAVRLGFENVSYFISFFKKMTSQTPQEYRELL